MRAPALTNARKAAVLKRESRRAPVSVPEEENDPAPDHLEDAVSPDVALQSDVLPLPAEERLHPGEGGGPTLLSGGGRAGGAGHVLLLGRRVGVTKRGLKLPRHPLLNPCQWVITYYKTHDNFIMSDFRLFNPRHFCQLSNLR